MSEELTPNVASKSTSFGPASGTEPPATTAIELRDRLTAILEKVVPGGMRCAIVDFPNHPNVGDSAVWLGMVKFLRERDANIVYSCDRVSYSETALRHAIGTEGTIIFAGGGNFGDVWPKHLPLREAITKAFPNNRIVQMPQSVYFSDPENMRLTAQWIRAHDNFCLIVRDQYSYDCATNEMGIPAVLAPDMVFALAPLPRPSRPVKDLVWLLRTDQETRGWQIPPGYAAEDWLTDSNPLLRLNSGSTWHRQELRPFWQRFHKLKAATFGYLLKHRMTRGLQMLSQGKVVITDRLHGHILCTLMEIPHVVLDNSYGKVTNCISTWTHAIPFAHLASTPEEALRLAQSLLDK